MAEDLDPELAHEPIAIHNKHHTRHDLPVEIEINDGEIHQGVAAKPCDSIEIDYEVIIDPRLLAEDGKGGAMKPPQKRTRVDMWSENYVLTNPKSPLVGVDLRQLLVSSYHLLTPEEQARLAAMVPPVALDEGQQKVSLEFVANNPDFRNATVLLQRDLSRGHLDPEWQRQAGEAMEMRGAGMFDDMLAKQREEMFGEDDDETTDLWDAKEGAGPSAGRSGKRSKMKMETCVRGGLWAVGDVWVLNHAFNGASKHEKIVVEKEATITSFEKRTINFTFPPGQHKVSFPQHGADIIKNGIMSPSDLSKAIAAADGRIEDINNGKAWETFRCMRGGQDMGTLSEMRQQFEELGDARPNYIKKSRKSKNA
ncbi:MAG: hypothetical protein M1827_003593 [Pycnora praestabilis]|nr:MAG: hypothetical protein M1827_003593 [Pycnora praestabilis]